MTDKQRNAISLSNTLIQEIKDNDIIVITAPMYNFSIPNQLKNYFDLIIRNGLTFSYTKTGKTGLITNKKHLFYLHLVVFIQLAKMIFQYLI